MSAIANATVVPANVTTVTPTNGNGNGNMSMFPTTTIGSVYWDGVVGYPMCPTCPQYVTIETPVIDYTYTYIYYCLLLLLLVVIIVCIKVGIDRRRQLQKQAAALRRQQTAVRRQQTAAQNRRVPGRNPENSFIGSNSSINVNDETSCQMAPKTSDSPPAYADIMQPQSNGKQQQNVQVTNGLETYPAASAASTSGSTNICNGITNSNFETDIPSNVVVHISNSDSNPTNASSPTNATSSPDVLATPTAHDTNVVVDIEKSKDHIV